MRRTYAIVVCAALVPACSGSHVSSGTRASTSTPHAVVVCDDAGSTSTVRHLESRRGSVWVWIESATRPRIRAGSLVKVVWRITGDGAPKVSLIDPAGRAARLTFGPERHGASTFDHPGAEYGTGFTPRAPGCWRLAMQRGDVESEVSFAVVR